MTQEMPTAEEISQGVDLTGKIALVTGANEGLGKETARVLVLRNARVIMACRSLQKGFHAKAQILSSVGQEKASLIEVLELDLSSLTSIRHFAETLNQKTPSLHLLINNAGAYYQSGRQTTKEGFEGHFGTNHLGPFYLTNLLLPLLKTSGTPSDPSRVIVVSSKVHLFAQPHHLDTDPRDLFQDLPYLLDPAYDLSKFCNILFSSELNRRLAGSHVVSTSLHPGLVITNLVRDIPREDYERFVKEVSGKYQIPILSIPQGAATTIFAAVAEEGRIGGSYFEEARISAPRPDALDPLMGGKLWLISERLVAEFEAGK